MSEPSRVVLQIRTGGRVTECIVEQLLAVDGKPFTDAEDVGQNFDEIARVLGVQQSRIESLEQQLAAIITGLAQRSSGAVEA